LKLAHVDAFAVKAHAFTLELGFLQKMSVRADFE